MSNLKQCIFFCKKGHKYNKPKPPVYDEPNKTKDISVINAFTAKLKVETDEKTLFHSGTSEYTSFWGQYLSEAQSETYANEPAVRRVFLEGEFDNVLVHAHRAYDPVADDHPASIWNETDLWQNKIGKQAPIVNQQRTTEDSLKVISQPPGIPLDTIDTYAFNRETPRSARIYMVDSGFAVSHASYTWIKNNIETPEWIWPGSLGAENHRYPYEYVYPDTFTDSDTWRNHGTGMAGRAVGAAYGVSEFAQLTVVRLPQGIPTDEEMSQLKLPAALFERSVSRNSVMTDAFRHILDDVLAKGLQKKAVINISRGIISKATTLPMLDSSLYEMFDLLRQLASHGVVIVVASGNVEDDHSKVMTSAFVHWSTAIPIIVVGSVYNSGTIWEYTKDVPANGFPGSTVHVWAPGVDMYFSTTVAFNTQRQKNSGTSGSTAMVSGLISYFLGVDSHREKIQQIANGLPDSTGYGWSEAIKKYLQDTSFPRGGANGRPVVYNGAIPLNKNSAPVCTAPPSRKRQDGDPGDGSCIFWGSDPVNSASTSLTSASSASLASASSASLVSVSSASLASVSSASLASVKLTASKTSSNAAPTVTDTFSGYIGSNCLQGNVAPMVHEDAAKVAAKLCGRSYTWDAKNEPPRDTKDTSVATVEADFIANGIKTLGQINPTEGVASACASGTYPRTLTADECQKAYTRPTGGQLSWVTKDHHGCMNFFMNQSPANPPPEVTNPPPASTSTAATPPPPPSSSTGQLTCFEKPATPSHQPLDKAIASEAIKIFCENTYTWRTGGNPADGEPGTDPNVTRNLPKLASSGDLVTQLQAIPWDGGDKKTPPCNTGGLWPRVLKPDECNVAFSNVLDSSGLGGLLTYKASTGCLAFSMRRLIRQ
ncbi:peptidase S8/S53 domain-containing protein [Leptodontidium sp. 2 PMI_412]|nr:peptidase S8/S53 domain-containing protein [Leptodontidium sp. 2 PMI_412]